MKHCFRVELLNVDRPEDHFVRDKDANTYYDAVSMVQQEAIRVHPDLTYRFQRVTAIDRVLVTGADEVAGVPA